MAQLLNAQGAQLVEAKSSCMDVAGQALTHRYLTRLALTHFGQTRPAPTRPDPTRPDQPRLPSSRSITRNRRKNSISTSSRKLRVKGIQQICLKGPVKPRRGSPWIGKPIPPHPTPTLPTPSFRPITPSPHPNPTIPPPTQTPLHPIPRHPAPPPTSPHSAKPYLTHARPSKQFK